MSDPGTTTAIGAMTGGTTLALCASAAILRIRGRAVGEPVLVRIATAVAAAALAPVVALALPGAAAAIVRTICDLVLVCTFVYAFRAARTRSEPAIRRRLVAGIVALAVAVPLGLTGDADDRRSLLAVTLAFALSLALLATQLQLVARRLQRSAVRLRDLAASARRDPLTGLFDRGAFEERFELLWQRCRRDGEPISLLLIDVDHFKAYNDAFGHLAGDETLRRIAAGLAAAVVRPADVVCRVGGEEFAVILPGTDATGAATVGERITAGIRSIAIGHAPGVAREIVTVSVGCATSSTGAVPRRLLFVHADSALYHAKHDGRDRVRTHQAVPRSGRRAG